MEEFITYEEVLKKHTSEIVGAVIEELKEIVNNPIAMLFTLTGGLNEK